METIKEILSLIPQEEKLIWVVVLGMGWFIWTMYKSQFKERKEFMDKVVTAIEKNTSVLSKFGKK